MESIEKSYELRPLVASDMGAICKIITAIGIKQFKECFNVDDFKSENVENFNVEDFNSKNAEQIGFGVVFDIAGIIMENLPKAELKINRFLSSLTGISEKEISKMPFADYGELIMQVVMKEEFRDFFKRAMKLFNR